MSERIIDKTTTVKNAEPLHLKLERFAKVSKISVTLNIDPNNPISMDQLLLGISDSNIKLAIEGFKALSVEMLGANIIDDNGESVKVLSSQELAETRKKHLY